MFHSINQELFQRFNQSTFLDFLISREWDLILVLQLDFICKSNKYLL
jgi:hypothetical protein